MVTFSDAVMAGHFVAFEDVVRVGVHADGADVAMDLFHAVTGPLAGEIVPFHGPGRAAALGDAADVDRLDLGEDVDLQLLADLDFLPGGKPVPGGAELANEPLGFGVRLLQRLNAGGGTLLLPLALQPGDVAALAAAGQATGLVQEPELHRFVTVAVGRLHLEDMARTRLDHGHRDYPPGGVKNLRHPDLAAE